MVVVFLLAVWLVVVKAAFVWPAGAREFVGRPAVDPKAVDPTVVGLGEGLLVIESAQWRQQAVLVLLALA